jgi:uncharacterized membrane protein YidH (DUF202 family)
MLEKEIIGGLAAVLGVAGYGIYMWQVRRRTIRPHMFTWIIWGVVMSIGFAAQYVEDSGPGAWNLGVGAVATILIAVASYFYGEKNITRGDRVVFIGALSAIPAWLATNDPLWAVVIISAIDAAAFYPTFRKSWIKPQEESLWAFLIGIPQFSLSIAALERTTLTTVLYPATIAVLNALLVVMLLWRRKALA